MLINWEMLFEFFYLVEDPLVLSLEFFSSANERFRFLEEFRKRFLFR